MFQDYHDAVEWGRDNEVQMVDLKFCDLRGRWRHMTMAAHQLAEPLFTEGVGFDGSSVGFKSVEAGDMVLVPDPTTATWDPFWETKTLSFICDVREAGTGHDSPLAPRQVAQRAEAYLHQTGLADGSRWGPEFEFYVFDGVRYQDEPFEAGYAVTSSEAGWGETENRFGYRIRPQQGYHVAPPLDELYNLRSEIVLRMEEAGVQVRYHHHEVGAPGQSEVEIVLLPLTRAADATMHAKYITRMVAHRRGKAATLMPKPVQGAAGNGMHVHQHLFKDDQPLFHDAAGYGGLSDLARYYVGGLLHHGPALLALTNPSTNSYRRLIPGFEAPTNLFYSLANRSAAIRIPEYATAPREKRIEFRPPDATCNIYLALAAMLMAGIDGIQRRIDPSEAGFGPFDENVYEWPPERLRQIKSLPTSLSDALAALEADHEFLLAGGVFSEELVGNWIREIAQDVRQITRRPHPYEYTLYFNC